MTNEDEILEGEFTEESAEIVHVPGKTVQLGMIELNPDELIEHAVVMANALKDIILRQRLYSMIRGKAHVHAEGWAACGAMLGVLPRERPELTVYLPDIQGWSAYVDLVRMSDMAIVGGAGAICTRTEEQWEDRDEYAMRSMAVTRATGKAYRLGFAWIMKLAGYEVLPSEEAEGKVQIAGAKDREGEAGNGDTRDDFPPPREEEGPTKGLKHGLQGKKKRGKAKPKPPVKRNENQWEEEIIAKAVDLGFANHAKNAVAVLNRSDLGQKHSYPNLPMVAAIAWFVCWDQLKQVYSDKSTDQRQTLCLEAWTNVQNREQYEKIARQSLGMEE